MRPYPAWRLGTSVAIFQNPGSAGSLDLHSISESVEPKNANEDLDIFTAVEPVIGGVVTALSRR